MNGLLIVDKPSGMTSHDVVDRVRRRFGIKKVGHAGTLDPDATGVLVLGLGKATRLLDFAKKTPKRYTAVAVLGITTTTQDASGDVVSTRPVNVGAERVEESLRAFRGPIDQVPPMVSAVKVGGERLYKKARRGEEIDRAARRVVIHDLKMIEFDAGSEPRVVLDVTCSPGTYVRTLVHDLGEALGCGAHLGDLRRTESGGFTLNEAISLDDVDESAVRPLLEALVDVPQLKVEDEDVRLVAQGRSLPVPHALDAELVALVHDGELVAVCEVRADKLCPKIVIAG